MIEIYLKKRLVFENDMFFKCHNCGQGQNLANFIKFIDPKMYEQYLLERYKKSAPATPKPEFEFESQPENAINIKIPIIAFDIDFRRESNSFIIMISFPMELQLVRPEHLQGLL